MYTLRYSHAASLDLRAIFDYIAAEQPSAAIRYLGELENAVLKLRDFPELGHESRYPELFSHGIRILPHDKYLVFYTVEQNMSTVTILRVLHGSRDYIHLF